MGPRSITPYRILYPMHCMPAVRRTTEAIFIRVSGRIEQDELRISVSDNGIGMTEELREKLFKKFYSTKGSKGTGLGLVITRKVVQEHGGSISVESEPGKGTSFYIRIPLKTSSPRQPANNTDKVNQYNQSNII